MSGFSEALSLEGYWMQTLFRVMDMSLRNNEMLSPQASRLGCCVGLGRLSSAINAPHKRDCVLGERFLQAIYIALRWQSIIC
mgnify:CR=1 FL=1